MPKKYIYSPVQDKLNRLMDTAFERSGMDLGKRTVEELRNSKITAPTTHGEHSFALNPKLPGDLERVYAVGEDGSLIQPFKGKTLSDEQIVDLLDNAEGKYYYCKAGEKKPLSIVNGYLANPGGELPPAIEGLKNREVPPMEAAGREADISLWEMDRMVDDLKQMYGQQLGSAGSDNYRTYIQNIVHHTQQVGGEVDYPNTGDAKFSELDFVALSMASMGDPSVSGDAYGFADSEITGFACVGIMPGDVFIHRAGNERHADWIANTRNATAEAIQRYVDDGDPSLLAEHIARSIDNLGLVAGGPKNFNLNAASQMYPAGLMNGLLRNHPDLMEAAQKYAQENGLSDQFRRGIENCRRAETLIQLKRDELQARKNLSDPTLSEEKKAPFKETVALSELIEADVVASFNQKGVSENQGKMMEETFKKSFEWQTNGLIAADEAQLTREAVGEYSDLEQHEAQQSALMGLLNEVEVGKDGSIKRTGLDKVKKYLADHQLADGLSGKTLQGKDVLAEMQKDGVLNRDGLDHSGTLLNRASKMRNFEDVMYEKKPLLEWAEKNGITKEDALKSGLSLSAFAAEKRKEEMLPPEYRKPERPKPPKSPTEVVPPEYEAMDKPEMPALSFGDKFTNFFKKIFTGKPIDKIARYEEKMARYDESQARDRQAREAYEAAQNGYTQKVSEYADEMQNYQGALRQFNEKMRQYNTPEAVAERERLLGLKEKELQLERNQEKAILKLRLGSENERIAAVADLLTCAAFQGEKEKPTLEQLDQFKKELMKKDEFKKLTANVNSIAEKFKSEPNGLKLGNDLLAQMNEPEQGKQKTAASAPQAQKANKGPQIGG